MTYHIYTYGTRPTRRWGN